MRIAPFKLERYFAPYEFSAPYLLCASDCESLSVAGLLQLERSQAESLRTLRLGYTQSGGSWELRCAVAGLYETARPDDVLLHAGSSEAIFSFMNCALSAGDHIIVQHPCYQSHYEVARSIGCDVTLWVGDEHDGWSLDPDFLTRNIRSNTKAVMLTVPHNPTGYLMTHPTQRAILDIAAAHGLWLFSDEIFRFLEQDPAQRPAAAADLYERAVSVGGLSKTFGLPGVRVGWAVTRDRGILSRMTVLKDYLSLCNGAVDELLGAIALRHRDVLHSRNLDIVIANLHLFDDLMARHRSSMSWQRPQAGTVGLVRYTGAGGTAQFCREAISKAGVLLLPSAELEFGDDHFRVGFGRINGPQCIARFDDFLTATR
ncbi:MAG: aminotransferase class I/II-fold pyridoxal phosphate-dependent enzyme [Candidatus Eremiobacteraeota bacterium]|nr:aminotransferase class I/II-fold pyridoxal phosphate-dependent enzyme [Candidatus Eremiobacteraeota bacterium]MBC5828455.1 aminotransferase class I/II-fold pyridoxal phosphate-dependent enzyme [Candidatus Eremiobacteraeota bacterium]